MKLKHTVGFEMTGIIPDYKEKEEYPTEATKTITFAISVLISRNLVKKYPKCFEVQRYVDGHCLEFQSPVFKTIKEMDTFYLFLRKQFRNFGVTPHHPVTVCGGNHMHFGVNLKKDFHLIRNIYRHMTDNPWISWIFTQPDDTDSCSSLMNSNALHEISKHNPKLPDIVKSAKIAVNAYATNYSFANNWANIYLMLVQNNFVEFGRVDVYKDFAITLNRPKSKLTLEFRCIESPLNYKEFVAQREFFIAYVNYMAKSSVTIPTVTNFLSFDELQKIPSIFCHAQFNILLKKLGLNPKRYDKYVNRNLYPRWKCGRQRP